MCKSKRSAFRQEKFDNMDKALFDNEELWKQFKNFREPNAKNTVSEKISAHDWKNHFQKLHSENRDQAISLIAENNPSESLNKPYKMKELFSVIKKNEK